jgi:3,2-trans-enoyl-CoA isomerase
MCCDYRVMTESGHIGLNEVAIGITVPLYWGKLMARIIGQGPAERLCQFATFLSPQVRSVLFPAQMANLPVCKPPWKDT